MDGDIAPIKDIIALAKNTDLVQWISTDGKGEDSRDNMVLKVL